MNGIAIIVIAIVALGAGYIFYGRWLARKWGVDDSRKTPAVEINDGIDYVPTKPQVVFGHQFASIAATVAALIQLILNNIRTFGASAAVSVVGQSMQIILAVLLVALAIVVVIACCRKLFGKDEEAKA